MAENGRQNGQDYAKGDWIVHLYHGVGQIKGVVKKQLSGKEKKYYRVKTHNSIIFIPVKKADNSRIRPLTPKSEFRKALKVLERPPREMSSNHTTRKKVIREAKIDGSVEPILRIVRDLTFRQHDSKLNTTEKRALNRLKDRLMHEWSACMQIEVEEARENLEKRLQPLVTAE
ncbi:MAG TPA: CarD family transcriptional regulator [Anaerolineales bacterium]